MHNPERNGPPLQVLEITEWSSLLQYRKEKRAREGKRLSQGNTASSWQIQGKDSARLEKEECRALGWGARIQPSILLINLTLIPLLHSCPSGMALRCGIHWSPMRAPTPQLRHCKVTSTSRAWKTRPVDPWLSAFISPSILYAVLPLLPPALSSALQPLKPTFPDDSGLALPDAFCLYRQPGYRPAQL